MRPQRIGPYRIVERLGKGGMGEVFRAWDEDLDRWVAIKLIRAAALESATSQERFRREARTIAALDHPAIVRIYHVQQWQERDCIVMEYVEGKTLTTLLRYGPLELPRAIALILEITGGLAAAHAQGMIHRDLKADNIMVTSAGHPTPGRAKILDFGLAKRPGSREPALSAEGKIIGTFHSMSPEQAQGHDVDHRSDLFSLGTLLYQVVTGEVPFRGGNVTETLAQVCMHRQPQLRQVNPLVPEELSDLTDRLLEKRPDRRPQSATEVVTALRRLTDETGTVEASGFSTVDASRFDPSAPAAVEPADSPTVDSVRPTVPFARRVDFARRKPLLLAAIGVLVAAAVGVLIDMILKTDRPSVAVLGFENRTGNDDDAWLSTAIAEILTADLAAGGQIRTAGPARTARAMNDLGLAPSASLAAEELARLRLNVDADYYMMGFYESASEDLQLVVHLQEASGGDIENISLNVGSREELFDLAHTAVAKLRKDLGAGAMRPENEHQVAASYPAPSEAAKLHAEGLARLRSFDRRGARQLLERAVETAEHPLSSRALAEALFALGFELEAGAAAKRAITGGEDLSRESRLELEAYSHWINGEYADVAEIYGQLFREFSDDVGYGLKLANARISNGNEREALAILDDLRRPDVLSAGQAEIEVTIADAHFYLGELDKASLFVGMAVDKARHSGANHLEAEALLTQAKILDEMGEHQDTLKALDAARVGFEVSADRVALNEVFGIMATVFVELSNFEEAARYFERLHNTYRANGDLWNVAILATNYANLLSQQGHHADAIRFFEEALPVFERFDADREVAIARLNLGAALHEAGELDAALSYYEEARLTFEVLADREYLATAINNIGEIRYLHGELTKARGLHQAVARILQERVHPSDKAYTMFRLGEIYTAMGELDEAEREYQSALAVQIELEMRSEAALTRIGLAKLRMHQGNLEEAANLALQAEGVLWKIPMADEAVIAKTVAGTASLKQGDFATARELSDLAENHSVRSEDPKVRFAAKILAARVSAASGDPEEISGALEDLEDVVAEATAAGLVVDELEARFALAVIEMEAGRASARARFEALAADAGDKGFGLIVNRVGEQLR